MLDNCIALINTDIDPKYGIVIVELEWYLLVIIIIIITIQNMGLKI